MAEDSPRKLKKLVKELERAAKDDPGNLVNKVKLAGAYRDLGQKVDAIRLYREVALAYQQQGRRAQALAVCRGILEIDPAESETRVLVARLEGEGGEPAAALPLPVPMPGTMQGTAPVGAQGQSGGSGSGPHAQPGVRPGWMPKTSLGFMKHPVPPPLVTPTPGPTPLPAPLPLGEDDPSLGTHSNLWRLPSEPLILRGPPPPVQSGEPSFGPPPPRLESVIEGPTTLRQPTPATPPAQLDEEGPTFLQEVTPVRAVGESRGLPLAPPPPGARDADDMAETHRVDRLDAKELYQRVPGWAEETLPRESAGPVSDEDEPTGLAEKTPERPVPRRTQRMGSVQSPADPEGPPAPLPAPPLPAPPPASAGRPGDPLTPLAPLAPPARDVRMGAGSGAQPRPGGTGPLQARPSVASGSGPRTPPRGSQASRPLNPPPTLGRTGSGSQPVLRERTPSTGAAPIGVEKIPPLTGAPPAEAPRPPPSGRPTLPPGNVTLRGPGQPSGLRGPGSLPRVTAPPKAPPSTAFSPPAPQPAPSGALVPPSLQASPGPPPPQPAPLPEPPRRAPEPRAPADSRTPEERAALDAAIERLTGRPLPRPPHPTPTAPMAAPPRIDSVPPDLHEPTAPGASDTHPGDTGPGDTGPGATPTPKPTRSRLDETTRPRASQPTREEHTMAASPMGKAGRRRDIDLPLPTPGLDDELTQAFDGPFARLGAAEEARGLAIVLPLFEELPAEAHAEILRRMAIRRIGPGTLIVREGDPGDACYVIAKGQVRVLKRTPDGRRLVEVARLGDGSLFGEFALLADRKRHASVEALTDVELFEIPRRLLDEIAVEHPGVGSALERFYRERLLSSLVATAPFFRALPPDERPGLAQLFHTRHVEAGEVIIQEGEPAGGLFLIVLGGVHIMKKSPTGPLQLAQLGEGSYFGEMSLLRGGVASATVVAADSTELAELPARDFYQVVAAHPTLWEEIRREAARRELATHQILAGESNVV